jgi:KAP family P-loop domain
VGQVWRRSWSLQVGTSENGSLICATKPGVGWWGSGKSTILKLIERSLCERGGEGVSVLETRPWEHDPATDPKAMLIADVLTALQVRGGAVEAAEYLEKIVQISAPVPTLGRADMGAYSRLRSSRRMSKTRTPTRLSCRAATSSDAPVFADPRQAAGGRGTGCGAQPLSGRRDARGRPAHADWYLHGQLHREDGTAIEKANGTRESWLGG